MKRELRIDKMPTLCTSPDQLQAGDIVMYSHSPQQASHPARGAQFILNNSGGHKDMVHAAYIVEIDGEKKVAHIRYKGFVLDDINTLKTTCHIYRPRIYQREIAAELNNYIQTEKDKDLKKIKWVFWVSMVSLFKRVLFSINILNKNTDSKPVSDVTALPTRDKYMSTSTICSKFVAESYASSCYNMSRDDPEHHDFRQELMNISTNTVPKTLQAYLHRCSNYEYYVLPNLKARNKLTVSLLNVIKKEIVGIRKRGDMFSDLAPKKADALEAIVKRLQYLELPSEPLTPQQDFDFAQKLLQDVLPILKINTGANFRKPTSYVHVRRAAKALGLFEYHLEHNSQFNMHGTSLIAQAQEVYKFNRNTAKLYSDFRQHGYSDKEAEFECKPTFEKWLKINKRRNTAAAVTVLPFLLFSLPYGLYVVKSAQNRNARLTDSVREVELSERAPLLRAQ